MGTREQYEALKEAGYDPDPKDYGVEAKPTPKDFNSFDIAAIYDRFNGKGKPKNRP